MNVSNTSELSVWFKACALASIPLLISCDIAWHQPAPPSPLKPVATLQEIMTDIIDPNIDFVWNSVSSISTANGSEQRQPQSDEDWLALRQHALAVAEAANLLLIEDRPIAADTAATSSGGAELNPPEIKALIAAHHGEFTQRAQSLRTAAQGLLTAIAAKNAEALENAGGAVEQACEQCHSQFWYPGDAKPK
jgi:hypothetical protein